MESRWHTHFQRQETVLKATSAVAALVDYFSSNSANVYGVRSEREGNLRQRFC